MNKLTFHFCRWIAALIMLQTLYYKFGAHPDSVMLFTELGLEPHGRIGTGIAELIASLLLIYTPKSWLGGALGVGLMGGAILSHLTTLGVVFNQDGGLLFGLAVIVFLASAYVIFYQKEKWLAFLPTGKAA